MAPRGMKRKASAEEEAASTQRAKARAVEKMCTSVSEAVGAASLPAAVCKMLADGAPGCLREYKDQRHAFQENMVHMIGSALAGTEAENQKATDEAQATVDGAATEKASREKAVADADAVLQVRKASTAGAKEALKAAEVAAAEAKTALHVADKSVDGFVGEAKAAEAHLAASQDKMSTFVNGPKAAYDELKDRSTPPPEPEEPEEPAADEAPAPEASVVA